MASKKSPGKIQYARVTLIDSLVRQKRYPNIADISERTEMSKRTIERDIEALRDYFCAPIEYDHFKKGYYYSKEFRLPQVKLSQGEALALIYSQQLFSQFKGTPFADSLKDAIAKLYSMLPETISLDLDAISRQISFDVAPLRGEEEQMAIVYEQVAQAITDRTSLQIEYYAAYTGETSIRTVDPYHLRYHRGAWYLIAYCHLRECIRVFAVDRINACRENSSRFELPEGFSTEKYLEHAFGIEVGEEPTEVAIYFNSYVARFLRETDLHSSQEIEEQNDGGIIIRMRLSGLGEVKRWVMSFGMNAKVLEPAKLKQEVLQEYRDAVAAYEKGE